MGGDFRPRDETSRDSGLGTGPWQRKAQVVREKPDAQRTNRASLHENAPRARYQPARTIVVHACAAIVHACAAIVHGCAAIVHGCAGVVHARAATLHGRDVVVHARTAIVQARNGVVYARAAAAHGRNANAYGSDGLISSHSRATKIGFAILVRWTHPGQSPPRLQSQSPHLVGTREEDVGATCLPPNAQVSSVTRSVRFMLTQNTSSGDWSPNGPSISRQVSRSQKRLTSSCFVSRRRASCSTCVLVSRRQRASGFTQWMQTILLDQ